MTSVAKSCGGVVGRRLRGEFSFCMGDGAAVVELVVVVVDAEDVAISDVATAFLRPLYLGEGHPA